MRSSVWSPHNNNDNNNRVVDGDVACWMNSEDAGVGTRSPATTETGSLSEDDSNAGGVGMGWLGGMASDIRTLACTLRETAGGVASFVQRSALAVASEIAHLEEEELAHQQQRSHQEHLYDENVTLRLPWEVLLSTDTNNNEYREDVGLKQCILALSSKEETFLRPYSARDVSTTTTLRPPFVLDEPRIRLVGRILSLDKELATMHARLSGRSNVKEAVFWQNYFYNCEVVRDEYLGKSTTAGSTFLPLQQLSNQNPIATMESFEDTATEAGETDSFIEVPSPPASQRSIGSMVVVNGTVPFDLPE